MDIFCDCKYADMYFCQHSIADGVIHKLGSALSMTHFEKSGEPTDALEYYVKAKRQMEKCLYRTKRTWWQKILFWYSGFLYVADNPPDEYQHPPLF